LWGLRKRGYSESTLEGYSKKLRLLSKLVCLDSPEDVTRVLTNKKEWKNSFKETCVNAYLHYVRFYGLKWRKPKFRRAERLPYVPSGEQVQKLIAHSSRKFAMIYSILRDTGLRPVELHRLILRGINLESGLIIPESAKSGRGRVLKLKTETLAMLRAYVTEHDFGLDAPMFPSTKAMSHIFIRYQVNTMCKCKVLSIR
jgi:integrase